MRTPNRRAPAVPAPATEFIGGKVRTCVGCGARLAHASEDDPAVVHFVVSPDGEVAVDAAGRGGRGAHVHATASCLEGAVQRGLPKSFRRKLVTPSGTWGPAAVADLVIAAYDRRIEGLLVSARRCRASSIGADAVTGDVDAGVAELVVVATDAAAAAQLGAVRRAVTNGKAVAWSDKATLARIVRAGGSSAQNDGAEAAPVAVVSITDSRLARAIRESVLAREAAVLVHQRGAVGRREPTSWERGA